MFNNLPKIGDESSNKRLKTEEGVNNRNHKKYLTIKSDISNNKKIKDKKIKNRSGNSLDMKLFYKKEKSPLKFNSFMRNITFDALKNKEIKLSKKATKNKSYNTSKFNKSSETLKYLDTNPNININIKNNINIFFELKDKVKSKKNSKYKNTNNNLEINIFKNNNFIMKNNNTGRKINETKNDKKYSENNNSVKIIRRENKNNIIEKKDQMNKENKTLFLEKNMNKNMINR